MSDNKEFPWKIVFDVEPYQKIRAYTTLTQNEISGMAKSIIDVAKKEIKIVDIVIFEQVCTGSSTDLSEESMAKFIHELMKKEEDTANWNVWWHSHAGMRAFWSATDSNTILQHCGNQDYMISIVTNHDNDFEGRLDLFLTDNSPFGVKSLYKTYEDLEVTYLFNPEDNKVKDELEKQKDDFQDIIDKAQVEFDKLEENIEKMSENPIDPEIEEECKKEIKEKVSIPKQKFSGKKKGIKNTIDIILPQTLSKKIGGTYDDENYFAPYGIDEDNQPIARYGINPESGYVYGSMADEDWWIQFYPKEYNRGEHLNTLTNLKLDVDADDDNWVGPAYAKTDDMPDGFGLE